MRSDVLRALGIKRMFLSLCDVPLWLHYITGNLYSWVYVDLIVPSFTWLVSQIYCTVMDVLTVQYCGLIKLPVFRLVFFFALFVSHAMYCNISEKTLYA